MSAKAVVIDNGSLLCKAGIAGEKSPSCIIKSFVATRRADKNASGPTDVYFASDPSVTRAEYVLKYPVEYGCITDWEKMEKLWSHVMCNQLGVTKGEKTVLLTEPLLNTRVGRQKTTQIMFENLEVPNLCMATSSVLSLYAYGKTNGFVVEIGDRTTNFAPIYEGMVIKPALARGYDIAGADLTYSLTKSLKESGKYNDNTIDGNVIRDIKEKLCYVALDYKAEQNIAAENGQEKSYELPDGQTITLLNERFSVPEGLFKPELLGNSSALYILTGL
jgi:actin